MLGGTDLVQFSHIDPRSRYQVISRSLRAYSDRSRAEEGVGTRRRLSAMSSSARAVMRGLLSLLPEASIVAWSFECAMSDGE